MMLRTFENKQEKAAVDEAFPSFEAYIVCFQKTHVTTNIQQQKREACFASYDRHWFTPSTSFLLHSAASRLQWSISERSIALS